MFLFILVAFLGGVLSILSPCSGALLPTYFALTFKSKKSLFKNTLYFSLGVMSLAIPIGLGAQFIFKLLSYWGKEVFVFLGLFFILVAITTLFEIKIFQSPKLSKLSEKGGFINSYLFGLIAAFSLGACSGPILGAIATLAASSGGYIKSIILMLFYTLGILLPFLLISLGIDKLNILKKIFVQGKLFQVKVGNKQRSFHSSNIISALVFMFVGVIFIIYNGSVLNLERSLNINTDVMLQLQETLLNLLN